MKLKKLLKYLNFTTKVILWDIDDPQEEKPLFEGNVDNVPWSIVEHYRVATPEESDAAGCEGPLRPDDAGDHSLPFLVIMVREA